MNFFKDMDKNSKIYIAGHTGLVGSALLRKYRKEGYRNLIVKTHQALDLTNQKKVDTFFRKEQPEYVIIAAAKVGGIKANITFPVEFMYENLAIQNNLIWSALKHNVKKLLYISCDCSYPTHSKQPIREEYLLTGVPEPTNEGFALAKIAGIKLCEKIYIEYGKKFISCIPANTYGVGDHFDEERSHVIPALIKRFHHAKINHLPSVTLWGTGKVLREFIYVDDLSEAIFLLMEKYNNSQFINIGAGEEINIKDLAFLIKKIVGFKGEIMFDKTKPDGMLRRLLDSSSIMKIGFKPKLSLQKGIKKTYQYFLTL